MLRRIRRWAKTRLFALLRPGWKLASGYEIEAHSLVEWNVFGDLFLDGEYDRAIEGAIQDIRHRPEATILDLGANLGFFAIRFMDRLRRTEPRGPHIQLIMVEASPNIFPILRQRTAQLASPLVKLHLHQGLVGERSGEARFQQAESHLASHVSAQGTGPAIPYLDLETLVPAGPIALLKCDIEGSEDALLKNYPDLLARTERLVVEFHHHVRPVEDFIAATCAHGFPPPQCLHQVPDYSTWFFCRTSAAPVAAQ